MYIFKKRNQSKLLQNFNKSQNKIARREGRNKGIEYNNMVIMVITDSYILIII